MIYLICISSAGRLLLNQTRKIYIIHRQTTTTIANVNHLRWVCVCVCVCIADWVCVKISATDLHNLITIVVLFDYIRVSLILFFVVF